MTQKLMDRLELQPSAWGFETGRGIDEYNCLHGIDFVDFIRKRGFQRGTVVDVGCGEGVFLKELKEIFPNLRVIGIDRKFHDSEEYEHITADVRDMSYEERIADVAVSTCVSPWVYSRKDDFYRGFCRLISPQGVGFVFPVKPSEIPENLPKEKISVREKILNGNLKVYSGIFGNYPFAM